MTAEIQMKSIENVQNYSDIHESPMPASEVKILHSPDQNTSDSDIVSMQKQFETIYHSQDIEYQPDAFKTQDSQIASKPNKQLKKKNLKRRDGQKVGLNLKQSASSVKRKKRKSSRSKRRGSNSKKRYELNNQVVGRTTQKKMIRLVLLESGCTVTRHLYRPTRN